MDEGKIRILVVLANPDMVDKMIGRSRKLEGIEVVGVAHNRNAAIAKVDELQPDVMVVDLMLPGYRSIDLIRRVTGELPQVRILAAAPADPPHDRVMLAAEAGALGFICVDASESELMDAVRQVKRGEPWLPLHQTYEVLQDGAGDLPVSSKERRARLTEVLLGLIPITGLIAAITAYLWRNYWGAIGVRVTDLGVDPSTRMIDVLVVFLIIIGVAGPILFARPWVKSISQWIGTQPRLAQTLSRLRRLHIGNLRVGKYVFNFWVAWVLMVALILAIMIILVEVMPLIMVLVVGPFVAIVLVANLLELDDELPDSLHLPHLDSWRVMGFLGIVLVGFLLILGTEVHLMGPDLQPDGLHGFIAPKVLGFRAIPMMLYDLDEKHEPLGALYLGGNADLYVLYDPCKETVRLIPVGSSRVELIDRVDCSSQ